MSKVTITHFDYLLQDDGPIALTLIRELEPAEGKNAWIFPPTFAASDSGDEDEEGSGKYCIDRWEERNSEPGHGPIKRNVCLFNSVGSEANFIEPLFKNEPYNKLVPQRTVKFKDGSIVNLLDAGHRAADAAFRFSKDLGKEIWDAFEKVKTHRDYSGLIELAPTSLLFGVWDSRATGVKCQRIVRSIIRGYDVVEASRSAIYNPPIDYVDRELIRAELDKGAGKENPLSQEGFKHSPASGSHGGVRVTGSLQREAMINLAVLRSLSQDTGRRRYLLALALVAMSCESPSAFNLREGCLLRPVSATPDWKEVWIDKSKDESFQMSHATSLEYAKLATAAGAFKVAEQVSPVDFDTVTAEAWVAKPKKERKKSSKKMHPSEAVK